MHGCQKKDFIFFQNAKKNLVLMWQQSIIDNTVTLAIFISCLKHVFINFFSCPFVFCKELLLAIRYKKETRCIIILATKNILFILHICVTLAVKCPILCNNSTEIHQIIVTFSVLSTKYNVSKSNVAFLSRNRQVLYYFNLNEW